MKCDNVMKLLRALYTYVWHTGVRGLCVIHLPSGGGSSSLINTMLRGRKMLEDLCSELSVTDLVGARLICKPQQDGLGETALLGAYLKSSCACGM